MSKMREALIIQPDGEVTLAHIETDYPGINRALEAQWIEAIYAADHSFFLDEEGKLAQRPQNPVAEAIYKGLGGALRADDFLVGPVLILGPPDQDGDSTDVSPELVALIHEILENLQDLLDEDSL